MTYSSYPQILIDSKHNVLNQLQSENNRWYDNKCTLKRDSLIMCVGLWYAGDFLKEHFPCSTSRNPCCLSCFFSPTCQQKTTPLPYPTPLLPSIIAEEIWLLKQNSNHKGLLCIWKNVIYWQQKVPLSIIIQKKVEQKSWVFFSHRSEVFARFGLISVC